MCPAAKDAFSPAGHAAPPYKARESWADRVVRPYRGDVVPQGHLFRCAPLQDAVPYGAVYRTRP